VTGSAMRAEVKRAKGLVEVKIVEGCHILEVSNDDGDEAVSIARARVEPGVTTRWHRLRSASERYIIVSGRGRMEIQGVAPRDVGAGDVVRIPPGVPQRITNTGEEDLLFYCVCAPRFRGEDYEDVEDFCNG
jgi:mannose-6-phosphate isomerase-like protein (cupin superfamily)